MSKEDGIKNEQEGEETSFMSSPSFEVAKSRQIKSKINKNEM
jgi:hypothetical protein